MFFICARICYKIFQSPLRGVASQVQFYLQVRHTGGPNRIHSQLGAGKAHKIRLLREEAISEQPPGRKQGHMTSGGPNPD